MNQERLETEMESVLEKLQTIEQTARNILVAGIVVAVGYGVWVGTIQASLTQTVEIAKQNQTRVTALEINNGEIKTRLTSIEATLQEIKIAINQLR